MYYTVLYIYIYTLLGEGTAVIKDYSVSHEFFMFRFETGRVWSIQKPSGI